MLPAHSAFAMLTCCTLCRRPLYGRNVEPENIPHIVVGSLGRACDPPVGRGGARAKRSRALAAALCSGRARRAWRQGGVGYVFGVLRASEVNSACRIARATLYDVYGGRRHRKSGHGT